MPPWVFCSESGTPLDEENLGSYLETGTLYCLIGDPNRLEGVAIIDQTDIEFVGTDQRVRILLDQMPGTPLWGTIAEISEIDLEVAPRALVAHEDLPTVTDAAGVTRPASTTYQARVVLDDHAQTLVIGASGRAKIHVAPQSLGQRLYRFLSGTFRFEL